MYEVFFNLTMKPFDLLPDPEFLFLSKSHKRTLSYLNYGIRERAGFILLTGEVGCGKTTVIRNIMKTHLDNVLISKIFNTRVDSEQLFAMINDDFGLPVQGQNKTSLLRDLNDFLIEQYLKGNHPVLILDEAQNLSPDLLEEVRMLSNLETDNAKLLQIILVGQPELRTTLGGPAMIQLRQRISINCHIQPLNRLETELYILHRLEKAGDRNAASFPLETIDIIFKYSRGIPRLINIICEFLMISAFAAETTKIDVEMVKDVISDLDFDNHFWGVTGSVTAIPARSCPAQPDITAPEEKEIFLLIRDINERLDHLGRGAETSSNALLQEMTIKITTMEESLKLYQQETHGHICQLRKTINNNVLNNMELHKENNKKTKGSIFSRVLGFRSTM